MNTPTDDLCGHCGSQPAIAYVGETACTCAYRICADCLAAGAPSEFATIILDSEIGD